MPPRTALSPQTRAVLAALASQPSEWRHGYDLARETRLKSGTLYPILIRLADRKFVEACWEADQPAGRPRRHLYRLTRLGLAAATAAPVATAASAAAQAPARAARPRQAAAPRRLAGECP